MSWEFGIYLYRSSVVKLDCNWENQGVVAVSFLKVQEAVVVFQQLQIHRSISSEKKRDYGQKRTHDDVTSWVSEKRKGVKQNHGRVE
mmetsp:Transcript_16926/g.47501  ORF Transcript_16926/g.47501 Transcript_16926/m.47501 type:complete len:87 (+) Transcript_16926:53-313(+)